MLSAWRIDFGWPCLPAYKYALLSMGYVNWLSRIVVFPLAVFRPVAFPLVVFHLAVCLDMLHSAVFRLAVCR